MVKIKFTGLKMAALSLDFPEEVTGLELKVAVQQHFQVENTDGMDLIMKGKVLQGNLPIRQQVGPAASLVCMVVRNQRGVAAPAPSAESRVQAFAETAERLAARTKDAKDEDEEEEEDKAYFQIENQNGELMNIPRELQASLTKALALHEKAKAVARHSETALSLALLQEAEGEFLRLPTDLLAAVDNYAYLSLDIAWALYKLGNPDPPELVRRLGAAERGLSTVHGPNLQRLYAAKGVENCASETAAHARLNLLQAGAALLGGDLATAARQLYAADQKLKLISVDEGDLLALIGMGFHRREANAALRQERDVEAAAQRILHNRAQKEHKRQARKLRHAQKRAAKEVGTTDSGEPVDLASVQLLVSTGFNRDSVVAALKRANNESEGALQLLTQDPLALETDRTACLPEILSMGFSEAQAHAALTQSDSVSGAIDLLLSGRLDALAVSTEPPEDQQTDEQPPAPDPQAVQEREFLAGLAEEEEVNLGEEMALFKQIQAELARRRG